MLTDTTFWVDLIEEGPQRQGRASQFLAAHRAHELRVSIITWEELAEGMASGAEVNLLLRNVRLTLIQEQIAWETSRIQRELNARGRRLGENDAWIAGTARAWGMRLVSNDTRFQDVPGLNLVPY